MGPRSNGYLLVLERARDLIDEAVRKSESNPPYEHWYMGWLLTGTHFLWVKRNSKSASKIGPIYRDAINNLRSALDHAYFEIVDPHVLGTKEKRNIQFPFSKDAVSFEAEITKRHANKVGKDFVDRLRRIAPYRGSGGNGTLVNLHFADISGKHKKISLLEENAHELRWDEISRIVPFCPFKTGGMRLHRGAFDAQWRTQPFNQAECDFMQARNGVLEMKMPTKIGYMVNCDIDEAGTVLLSPDLREFVTCVEDAIRILTEAAR